jgi:hypothetical protein
MMKRIFLLFLITNMTAATLTGQVMMMFSGGDEGNYILAEAGIDSDTSISVRWHSDWNRVSYTVQKGTDGATWYNAAEVNDTSYVDTQADADTTYYYRVIGYSLGRRDTSNTVVMSIRKAYEIEMAEYLSFPGDTLGKWP